MHKLMERWKEGGEPLDVLEKALRHLTSQEHGDQTALFKKGDFTAYYIAYTLQRKKGMSPGVSMDDAQLLLDLIAEIRSQVPKAGSRDVATMVERAGPILLNGENPPQTYTDDLWKPVLEVLKNIDPLLAQPDLF